jgi:guanine nucleotide-binding protein G(i) subunit alpha
MVAMGSCMSTSGEESEQRKRSNKIDKEIEEDSRRLRKECKILLLGMFIFVFRCKVVVR